MNVQLVCPRDGAPLVALAHTSGYTCVACQHAYPVEQGVIRFMDTPDTFYEGAYLSSVRYLPKNESWLRVWPLWIINSGYLWAVRKHVPRGATVVELGCAGGVAYFGQRFQMVGCDVSFASLAGARRNYDMCVQVDATRTIPLATGSVDAVVSSFFWEHIVEGDKKLILQECKRVLKKNGKIVFLYDVKTNNPLIRRYIRRDLALYEDLFLKRDGHIGYQSPEENRAIFEEAGFAISVHRGMEKSYLQNPSVYQKLSCYPGWSKHLFVALCKLGRQPLVYPYLAALRVMDSTFCRWLPNAWARISMVVAERA